MLVVSFDIGIINLGCSVLLDNKLIVWKVIRLFEKMKVFSLRHLQTQTTKHHVNCENTSFFTRHECSSSQP